MIARLAALVLAALLAACAGPTAEKGLAAGVDALDTAEEGEAFDPGASIADQVLDRIVKADTPAERALRLCFMTAGLADVWAYRLRFFPEDPLGTETAISAFRRFEAVVAETRAGAAGFWFESDLYDVVVIMVRAVGRSLVERGRGEITAAALSRLSIASSLRKILGQVGKGRAVARDILRSYDALAAGALEEPAAWGACQSRIVDNRERLERAIGLEVAPAAAEG